MAWYVTIRIKSEIGGKGDKLMYVTGRISTRNGYLYEYKPSKKLAKVFHNENMANEWADDIIDESVLVMPETVTPKKNKTINENRLRKV